MDPSLSKIVSYHAHIYYRTPEERAKAEQVRAQISEKFPVKMGRWRDMPVGPHDAPMYQVAFMPEVFPAIAPWLMLNRQDLVILMHPNTRAPLDDHLVHAFWYGEVLPIRDSELPESSDENVIVVPDARPGS